MKHFKGSFYIDKDSTENNVTNHISIIFTLFLKKKHDRYATNISGLYIFDNWHSVFPK